jgi:hypothetical protein
MAPAQAPKNVATNKEQRRNMNTTELTYQPYTQTLVEPQVLHTLLDLPGGTRYGNRGGRQSNRRHNGRSGRDCPRGGRSHHAPTPRPDPVAPCRAIVALINHHTGTPFGVGANPELDGQMPSERALLAVGYAGIYPGGASLRRMGFYGYREGQAVFRFALSFDPITSEPRFGEGRQPRAAELATINWLQGSLFNSSLKPGVYDFHERSLVDDLPKRQEFAAERRVESSQEMFSRFLGWVGASPALSLPVVTPLLSGAQLPRDRSPATLPVREFHMTPESYRAHALDRFVLGLSRTDGQGFEALKRAFIVQFDRADQVLKATEGDTEVGHMRRTQDAAESTGFNAEDRDEEGKRGILFFARTYLTQLNLDPEVLQRTSLVSYQSIKMLENYYFNRTESGKVIMYAPPLGEDADPVLFRKPSAFTVTGAPLAILDGVPSSGRFPYNASEISFG